MGTEQDFQRWMHERWMHERWMHERHMLFVRWGIYLVANSILFLGFFQAVDLKLGAFVALVGLAVSIAIAVDLGPVPRRLEKLEEGLNLQDSYKRKLISRKHGQFLLLVFLFVAWIWLFLYSIGIVTL